VRCEKSLDDSVVGSMKRDEPLSGCGMQQAHGPTRGESRQGGEKPRRRNMVGGWHRRPEGSLLLGVDARRILGGGATFERISREEAAARADVSDPPSALEGRLKPKRVRRAGLGQGVV